MDGVIKVYGTREVGEDSVELVGRQDGILPEEVPTTSVNGVIELYRAREELVGRQAEIPGVQQQGLLSVEDYRCDGILLGVVDVSILSV